MESVDQFAFENTSATPGALPSQNLLKHSVGITVTFVVLYSLIFLIGIVGNGLVILVISKRPQMRSATNMLIWNLAVADFLVIAFCVPPTLCATIFTPWILGSFMCKGMTYVQGVSVFASAYSLVVIAIDRCQGVHQQTQVKGGLSSKRAQILIGVIWIAALIITMPWLLVFEVMQTNPAYKTVFCLENWGDPNYGIYFYIGSNLICCYLLPFVIISFSNLLIWFKVVRRKMPNESASVSSITELHKKTRSEVRKMLSLVTIVFLISWMPLYIIVTRLKVFVHIPIGQTELVYLKILIPLAQLLGSSNSCVNPVIYAFMNTKFRKMFKSVIVHRRVDSLAYTSSRTSSKPRWSLSTISGSVSIRRLSSIFKNSERRQENCTCNKCPTSAPS